VARHKSSIRFASENVEQARVIVTDGILNSETYAELRNTIVKAALEEPEAVIVDVTALDVPSTTALSVFTSARWHVSTWPDVPIMLVCADGDLMGAIHSRGITRYVPAYLRLQAALASVAHIRSTVRRRARVDLPADIGSAATARTFVTDWLTAWDQPQLIPTASTVATIFVENVLAHTDSAPALILEHRGGRLTVAVEDASHQPATRQEDPERGADVVSGLAIVAALSRVWGSTPTASGKTVWAVIGPESLL
jgi:hypothetical protein